MTNDEYLTALDEQLKPVMRKYMSTGRIGQGRTVTAVQLQIENCMNDADDIQRDMMRIANNLKKEHGVVADGELKEQLLAKYISTLNKISNYRISGTWPE